MLHDFVDVLAVQVKQYCAFVSLNVHAMCVQDSDDCTEISKGLAKLVSALCHPGRKGIISIPCEAIIGPLSGRVLADPVDQHDSVGNKEVWCNIASLLDSLCGCNGPVVGSDSGPILRLILHMHDQMHEIRLHLQSE